jgi:catechol 2,3-dioxygenase-like lactoylglutathione lyase family enzyme
VHSINRFAFTVPSLDEAQRFYSAFGLDVRANGSKLELRAHGNPHAWGEVHANGKPKQLAYVSFGMYADDERRFADRIAQAGVACAPHPLSDGEGLWARDPDGVPIQIVACARRSPESKTAALVPPRLAPGQAAAPARSKVAQVRPRRLSHILRFTPDVPRMLRFCTDVLGLRLSDHSGEIIAFVHGPHGSDHHIMAFAKGESPGLHHSSWEVCSVDEVGSGAEQMRTAGYADGWGVGRHVLGSNYFYYVRDPWKSWAEYSFDIDFVPHDVDWKAGDHPPEDSIYVWGPPLHPEFITNFETAQ